MEDVGGEISNDNDMPNVRCGMEHWASRGIHTV